jgi:hypothetical protein
MFKLPQFFLQLIILKDSLLKNSSAIFNVEKEAHNSEANRIIFNLSAVSGRYVKT